MRPDVPLTLSEEPSLFSPCCKITQKETNRIWAGMSNWEGRKLTVGMRKGRIFLQYNSQINENSTISIPSLMCNFCMSKTENDASSLIKILLILPIRKNKTKQNKEPWLGRFWTTTVNGKMRIPSRLTKKVLLCSKSAY